MKYVGIVIESFQNGGCHIEGLYADKLNIEFPSHPLSNYVNLAYLRTDELVIYQLNNKAGNKLRIGGVVVDKVTFLRWHNDGMLNVEGIKSKKQAGAVFTMHECYLGNSEWYHDDLASFQKVEIYNCHLLNIVPVNVKWNFSKSAYAGIELDYLRELFRQLKTVCSKNMDKVSQLRFEALEMYAHTNQLKRSADFQDWFIFKSNQFSNNHGQSWLKPLGWLLLFSAGFYALLQAVHGNWHEYHLGNYLNFLLPFHEVRSVLGVADGIRLSNWVTLVDTVQKLVAGYFIFQFLRAFRKYVTA